MKNIVFIVLAALGFTACNSEEKKPSNPEMTHVALGFVHNPESITHVKDPINAFLAGAESAAAESYDLNKGNAKLMMTKLEEFNATVIVVENHTIVLVDKGGECQQSGSWGACMPFVKGYIKKGQLVQQEDFANNVIGKPDDKKRTIYFFNE